MVSYGVAFMGRNESGARGYVREIEPKGEEGFKERHCNGLRMLQRLAFVKRLA